MCRGYERSKRAVKQIDLRDFWAIKKAKPDYVTRSHWRQNHDITSTMMTIRKPHDVLLELRLLRAVRS